MKLYIVLAATTALALSGCKKSETAEPAAAPSEAATPADSAAPSAAAADAVTPAAFTAGEAPSKEFMVGRWGDGDKCELPMTFVADGTIKDGPFPRWSLTNGELSMEGSPQKMKLKVIDANTMETQIDADKSHTLKRC